MTKVNTECATPRRRGSERAISRDWAPFARNLTTVLSRLIEDQFLIVSAKTGRKRFLPHQGSAFRSVFLPGIVGDAG